VNDELPSGIERLILEIEKKSSNMFGKKVSILPVYSRDKRHIKYMLTIESVCFKEPYAFEERDFKHAIEEASFIGYIVYLDKQPSGYIFGTDDEEEILGSYHSQMFYLTSWAIVEEMSKRGLGRTILDLFMKTVRSKGFSRLMLHTPDTPENRSLNEALGFTFVNVEKDYYLLREEDRHPAFVYDAAVYVCDLPLLIP
jgi:ribosomal protein S18 acetylase RimI-like enzyme